MMMVSAVQIVEEEREIPDSMDMELVRRPRSTAIEAAKGVARNRERNFTMATIGSFTSSANGFTGSIKTLTLNVKARFERVDNPSDKGPHFRVYASGSVGEGAGTL